MRTTNITQYIRTVVMQILPTVQEENDWVM